jgi:hypothetical protein
MPGKRKNGTLENESDYFKSLVYDTISSSAEFAWGSANPAVGSLFVHPPEILVRPKNESLITYKH